MGCTCEFPRHDETRLDCWEPCLLWFRWRIVLSHPGAQDLCTGPYLIFHIAKCRKWKTKVEVKTHYLCFLICPLLQHAWLECLFHLWLQLDGPIANTRIYMEMKFGVLQPLDSSGSLNQKYILGSPFFFIPVLNNSLQIRMWIQPLYVLHSVFIYV